MYLQIKITAVYWTNNEQLISSYWYRCDMRPIYRNYLIIKHTKSCLFIHTQYKMQIYWWLFNMDPWYNSFYTYVSAGSDNSCISDRYSKLISVIRYRYDIHVLAGLPFLKGPLNLSKTNFFKNIFFLFLCHIEPTCQKLCFHHQNCGFWPFRAPKGPFYPF